MEKTVPINKPAYLLQSCICFVGNGSVDTMNTCAEAPQLNLLGILDHGVSLFNPAGSYFRFLSKYILRSKAHLASSSGRNVTVAVTCLITLRIPF